MLLSACFSSPIWQSNSHLPNNGVGKNTIIQLKINVFVGFFTAQKSGTRQSKSFSENELVKTKLCEV